MSERTTCDIVIIVKRKFQVGTTHVYENLSGKDTNTLLRTLFNCFKGKYPFTKRALTKTWTQSIATRVVGNLTNRASVIL